MRTDTRYSRGPRTRRPSTEGGFTLIEIMVVILILGMAISIMPVNFGNWGSRSRLESSGNSMVAQITSARYQAIFDGYDCYMEVGKTKKEDGGELHGWRLKFSSKRVSKSSEDEEAAEDDRERNNAREREWLYTDWHELPNGCEIVGVSRAKNNWERPSEGRPIEIRFDPAGNVDQAIAIRIENKDMEVSREYRTATVFINGLTSMGTWQMGEHDLIERRPSSEFGN